MLIKSIFSSKNEIFPKKLALENYSSMYEARMKDAILIISKKQPDLGGF